MRRPTAPAAVLLLALLLPASALSARATAPRAARPAKSARAQTAPNLLLVTLDTTRADRLGCYGYAKAATPALDRLARQGTRFVHAFSPVPLTLPAHASLFTGLLPREHGVRHNAGYRLPGGTVTLAARLRDAGYRTAAVIAADVLDRGSGIDLGFETFDDQVRVGPRAWFGWEERAASQVVDAALDRLPALTKDGAPFFLWVHFYDPHFAYIPPEPYRTRFKADLYDGEIAFVDAELARLLDAVERRTGTNLVVGVAGDHGEALGDHGERNHGVFVYQATQRIPLIVRGGGLAAGRTIDAPVALQDLGPTLVELAGAAPLPRSSAPDGGRSLLPLLRPGAEPKAASAAWPARDFELETHYTRLAFGWSPVRALVRWPHKFILVPRPELYDLAADPTESRDLAAARPDVASDLRRALAARLGPEYDRPPQPGDAERLDPEQVERLRSLGYAASGGGDGGANAGAYATIDPKDGILWLAEIDRARALIQSGRPGEAVRALEPVVAQNSGNLEATLALITATLGSGRPERAVALAREAVARWPSNFLTHFNLANALGAFAAQDEAARREAETEYRAALALFPRHAESVGGLSALLLAAGRVKDARDLLAGAAAQGLVDADLALRRGVAEASLGNAPAAREAFGQAARLDPTSAAPHEALGKLAFAAGDARAAVAAYRRALEIAPTAATARTLGAILLNALDDREGAKAAFRRALELEPQGPAADDVRSLLDDLR